jgi:hypothetical protein
MEREARIMIIKSTMTTLAAAAVIAVFTSSAFAAAGSNVVNQTGTANGAIGACSNSKQGQALIDCVADAMDRLSTNVNRGDAPAKAPEIISTTSEAGSIRGKPKAEALRVLNRVASIVRGLASKGAGDFQPAYNAVAGVFSRAIAVIERKG